jgi:WD40 repeat protein
MLAVAVCGGRFARDGPHKLIGEVHVLEFRTGREVLRHRFDHLVYAVAFDGGTRLAAAGGSFHDGWARIWDTATDKELRTLRGHTQTIQAVAFSRDGKRLVTAGADRLVKLWELETGREVLSLTGHMRAVSMLAFSRDGRRLFTGTGFNLFDQTTPAGVAAMAQPIELKEWRTD